MNNSNIEKHPTITVLLNEIDYQMAFDGGYWIDPKTKKAYVTESIYFGNTSAICILQEVDGSDKLVCLNSREGL